MLCSQWRGEAAAPVHSSLRLPSVADERPACAGGHRTLPVHRALTLCILHCCLQVLAGRWMCLAEDKKAVAVLERRLREGDDPAPEPFEPGARFRRLVALFLGSLRGRWPTRALG